jgi:hypothetical protein
LIFRRSAILSAIIIMISLISSPLGSADEKPADAWHPGQELTAAKSDEMVFDFVERIRVHYGITADQKDYETVPDAQGVTIRPRQDSAVAVAYSSGGATAEPTRFASPAGNKDSTVSAGGFNVAPPTQDQIEKARSRYSAGIQAEPNWFPTECWSRINFYDQSNGLQFTVGWSDVCHQLGWFLPTGGRGNWVFRMWQTCSTAQGSAQIATLTGCGVQNLITAPDPRWMDWAPRADAQIGTCSTLNYGISVGPISGSWSFPACDTIKIDKHNPEVYLKSWWSGRAWGKNRSSELVFSFTVPEAVGVSGDPRVSMSWDYCLYPGIDPCHDTN